MNTIPLVHTESSIVINLKTGLPNRITELHKCNVSSISKKIKLIEIIYTIRFHYIVSNRFWNWQE